MKPKREPVNYRKLKAAMDSPPDGPGEQRPGEVAGGWEPGRDDPMAKANDTGKATHERTKLA